MNKKFEISQRLKTFVEKNFSSVSDFARVMGKDRTFFTPYLSGKSILGGEILSRLNDLGCDINWLLTGNKDLGNYIVKDNSQHYDSNHNSTDLTGTDMLVNSNINGKNIHFNESQNNSFIEDSYKLIIAEKQFVIDSLKKSILMQEKIICRLEKRILKLENNRNNKQLMEVRE